MDSRNHIMFGSVGDWFYKALAGIDHAPGDVGFQNFVIAPSVVGDLMAVNASFLSGTLFLPSLFSSPSLSPRHTAYLHPPITRHVFSPLSPSPLLILYSFFPLFLHSRKWQHLSLMAETRRQCVVRKRA